MKKFRDDQEAMFHKQTPKKNHQNKQIELNTCPPREYMEPSPFSFASSELSLQPLFELSLSQFYQMVGKVIQPAEGCWNIFKIKIKIQISKSSKVIQGCSIM